MYVFITMSYETNHCFNIIIIGKMNGNKPTTIIIPQYN